MKRLIKTTLSALLIPLLRVLRPALEEMRRMHAHIIFGSRISSRLDPSVVVLGAPEVRGTRSIKVGRNLLLYPGIYLETQAGGSLEIGDDVVVSRGVHMVAFDRIRIGSGSMIGEYTSIRDANHVRALDGSLRGNSHSAAPITVGTQVWIGRGVTILPGVSIGDYATVGANAVVTRDVPEGATVAGVPAVPIRHSGERSATGRRYLREESFQEIGCSDESGKIG